MKKLIFLDVDGTLVGLNGVVSKTVQQAIRQARQNGHLIFLCTGRNRAGVRYLLPIGFDGIICSAGSYIEMDEKVIYESALDQQDIAEVRKIFTKNHILYNLEATNMTFQEEEMSQLFVGHTDADHANSEFLRLLNEQKDTYNIHPLSEYDAQPQPIHKICFIAKNADDLKEPQRLLADRYHFIIHEMFSQVTINGEIIPKKMDKGKAVEIIAKMLQIPLSDTIGFGDSMNDYQMIHTCGTGVVMANGSDELKQYATHICESVSDDGVYHEFQRLGLI